MRAAFFEDHVFRRDAGGSYYSNGSLPYGVFRRYLEHFDRLVVVGRVRSTDETRKTVASGDGVEMACIDWAGPLALELGSKARRHVREVLAGVDCAIIRMPTTIGRIACEEAVRMRRPWMAEVVGCVWDALWYHGSATGKLAAGPLFIANRRAISQAPFALYVTDRFLQERYPCRGTTIGCSDVVIEPPAPDVLERRLARIDAGWRGRPLSMGLVGSLDVGFKGHETAIRGARMLRDRGVDVTLRFLGEGDAARWRSLADRVGMGDRVRFHGTLPHGRPVLEWMDDLDLYLIPSLQEGLPRALIEAMSRAVPAVGSRMGGIPELIASEYVHPPKDARRLAGIVRELAGDPDRMKRCARDNWERARGYEPRVLDARRRDFLERFRRCAEARCAPTLDRAVAP